MSRRPKRPEPNALRYRLMKLTPLIFAVAATAAAIAMAVAAPSRADFTPAHPTVSITR